MADPDRKRRIFGFASGWAAFWLLLTAVAYLFPGDALAAFDIFPAWTWIGLALLPLAARCRRYDWRVVAGTLIVATALSFATTEEWRSLLRFSHGRQPDSFRIVVLNCASLTEAAEEVVPFRPDLVLLTENPGRPACEKIAERLFGKEGRAVVGPDGAILARAPLEKIETPRGTHDFTAAETVILGKRLGLLALRLQPPEFNIELFNLETWRSLTANRQSRRKEIETIAAWVRDHSKIRLMAGDYNAQPWDPSLKAMPEGFADVFKAAGTGWGHTAVNDYPLARIDQIWTRGWKPLRVWVQKTRNSDHRMVIAEFISPE